MDVFGISFGEIGGLLFLLAVALSVVAYPASRICRRAGFSPLLGVLSIIPVVNIGLLLFIAFAEWPAQAER